MRERPILFSGEMVSAILAGTKSQTRRVITPQPLSSWMEHGDLVDACDGPYGRVFASRADLWRHYYKTWPHPDTGALLHRKRFWIKHPEHDTEIKCPYGQPGDRLWVREKWAHEDSWYGKETVSFKNCYVPDRGYTWITYAADIVSPAEVPDRWRPSIFMPRWASRLTLEVRSVRVERLNDITDTDARAEGTAGRDAYQSLWDRINAKRAAWASNPWVWVVEFRRLS